MNSCVIIPSYNRLNFSFRCVNSIRKYNSSVDVYVAVESHQYKDYLSNLCKFKNVYVIPLSKKMLGVGYSIHYTSELVVRMGYESFLKTDDDVLFKQDVCNLLAKVSKKTPWVAGWFPVYDFFYKNKVDWYDDCLVKVIFPIASKTFALDSDTFKKVGGWNWKFRYRDDYEAMVRYFVNNKNILLYKDFEVGSLSKRESNGGVADTNATEINNRMKQERKIVDMLNSYGCEIASSKLCDSDNKIKFRLNWVKLSKNKDIVRGNLNKNKIRMNDSIEKKIRKIVVKQRKELKIAVSLPSFNRPLTCLKSVFRFRTFNKDMPILVTTEPDQYEMYKNILYGLNVVVVPLPMKRGGAGYAIRYNLLMLQKLGYRYVIRMDDDVLVQNDPIVMFEYLVKNEYSWIGGYKSIYDLFHKNNSNDIIFESNNYPSQLYGLDLKALEKVGGWDWNLRCLDDVDAVLKLKASGYKIGILRPMKIGLTKKHMEDGGLADSLDFVVNKSRVEVQLDAIKIIQKRFPKTYTTKADGNNPVKFNTTKYKDEVVKKFFKVAKHKFDPSDKEVLEAKKTKSVLDELILSKGQRKHHNDVKKFYGIDERKKIFPSKVKEFPKEVVVERNNRKVVIDSSSESVAFKPMREYNVFCVGAINTGQVELSKALNILGIHTIRKVRNYSEVEKLLKTYDGVCSSKIHKHYKELLKKYPNSKFILTIKPIDEWIVEISKKIELPKSSLRRYYMNHYNEVVEFFESKAPSKLLVLDAESTSKWSKLVNFLDNTKLPKNLAYPMSLNKNRVKGQFKTRENSCKIFGIGLSKTGTHSLQSCLKKLGYAVGHDFRPTEFVTTLMRGQYYNNPFVNNMDGLVHTESSIFFKQWDEAYPNSKFIYTVRPVDEWLNSHKRFQKKILQDTLSMKKQSIYMTSVVFGVNNFNRSRYTQIWERHDREVREYFKNRKKDILIIDLTEDDEDISKKICKFLGAPNKKCFRHLYKTSK